MTRRAIALACLAIGVAACALHLDLTISAPPPGTLEDLREEVRQTLRHVGLPAEGPLEADDVRALLERLTPAQEPARGPLYRLRRALERRNRRPAK